MIQTQVRSSRPVSIKAEKFSTLPCPYWWSASAGLSETWTERNVTIAATRSSPECAASDKMPRLPVVTPTTIFSVVMAIAASTELPATARFSARMDAGLWIAGELAIRALSPLTTASANSSSGHISATPCRQRRNSVLGFSLTFSIFPGGIIKYDAIRFSLSAACGHGVGPSGYSHTRFVDPTTGKSRRESRRYEGSRGFECSTRYAGYHDQRSVSKPARRQSGRPELQNRDHSR